MARQPQTGVSAQLESLNRALELGEGRLDPDLLAESKASLERSAGRTSLSSDNTVIGFFGATGSGKSSLFNAVVGQEIARTAVRRPTTSEALAAVWGQEGTEEVLDWLGVKERVYLEQDQIVEGPTSPWAKAKNFLRHRAQGASGGLILLDLPDFDSIEASNREVVERMIKMVDVMVWVFDPQKYADAVIHQEFIEPLASHGGVMMAVLNQSDRVEPREVPIILNSLQRQLTLDGLTDKMMAPPVAVSARTGEGIENLRTLLASVAEKKSAALDRVHADLNRVSASLQAQDGGGSAGEISKDSIAQLDNDTFNAAGGEAIVKAAGESYKIRAASSTGLVATRWLLKAKADPLKRLNLHKSTEDQELSRSSLPPLTGVQVSALSSGVRSFARRSSDGVSEPWNTSIKDAAMSNVEQLPRGVEKAMSSVDFHWDKKRWWWPVMNIIQWLALLCAIAGLGWLLSYTVAGFFQIQLPPPPNVEGLIVPVPTALLILAVLLALLVALTSRMLNAAGRKGYERRMKKALIAKIHDALNPLVVEPTADEIQRLHAYNQTLNNL